MTIVEVKLLFWKEKGSNCIHYELNQYLSIHIKLKHRVYLSLKYTMPFYNLGFRILNCVYVRPLK